ncbi:MAG: globin [Proteobacteria bacterium]|nr:globin [Pseudomonadota bacterium]
MSELHGDPTDAVYAQLFQRRPDLEALFVLDRTGVIRGNMLAHVFEALMDMEAAQTYGLHFFQSERVTHESGLGVVSDDYDTFLALVRDTIRAMLGDEWTPDVDAAWRTALAEIKNAA